MRAKNLYFMVCLFLGANISCASEISKFNDIPTANAGESAMITRLRTAINDHPQLSSVQNNIVIGAGTSGCEAFKAESLTGEQRVLLTWQWLDGLGKIAKDTIVVAPEHAIDTRFDALIGKGVRLITISGVLHNKEAKALEAEPIDMIDASIRYIVMLAGDAQQEDGTWVSYNSKMLAEFLKDLPTDEKMLILNGPRTGKHLENTTTVDVEAHKTKTDYITKIVQEKDILGWKIADFKYGAKSLWDNALRFCMVNPKVGLILPGESTSMISEALGLGIRPIVYGHGAMTPTSGRYIELLSKQEQIFDYPKGLKMDNYAQEPVKNQIDIIVKALVDLIRH